MTRQSDFKSRVRERMAKTGERYAAARAVLIGQAGPPPHLIDRTGIVPGYDRFGGVQPDLAAVANVLRQAGVVAPHSGRPFEESFLFGLGGGIGFMYFAFEYKGLPPMLTVALRSDSYPDEPVRRALEGSGAELEKQETGSPAVAARQLETALAAGRPAICVTDVSGLAYYGFPVEYRGFGPHYVAVVGRRDGDVILDDRARRPIVVPAAELADARSGYRKGKHRLITVKPTGSPRVDRPDPAAVVLEAIRGTVRGFHEALYAGFGSNFGMAGLERWATRIVDRRDPKGWPRLLADGPSLASALARMYDGIEVEFTAPGGSRPFYADFLDEAADITGRSGLRAVAGRYRASGEHWQAFARTALPDGDPTLRGLRESIERRVERIDELGEAAAAGNREDAAERARLIASFDPPASLPSAVLSELGGIAAELVRIEREALRELERAIQ